MKTPAKTFKDLVVWQKSGRLIHAVYHLTQAFARSETYGRLIGWLFWRPQPVFGKCLLSNDPRHVER
jgi:hypothetical protein